MKMFNLLSALFVASVFLISCNGNSSPSAEIDRSTGFNGKSKPRIKLEKEMKRKYNSPWYGELCLTRAIDYNKFQYATAVGCGNGYHSEIFLIDTITEKVVKTYKP